jgi:hypothetical protein
VIEFKVLATLSSMQKGKITGSDGLMVEFYIGFCDLLKDDFLKVVRESQLQGRFWCLSILPSLLSFQNITMGPLMIILGLSIRIILMIILDLQCYLQAGGKFDIH